jgi:hypothetical protein
LHHKVFDAIRRSLFKEILSYNHAAPAALGVGAGATRPTEPNIQNPIEPRISRRSMDGPETGRKI